MPLHPQVSFPAHCYHAVHSAHKSLWIPPVMAQVVTCGSLKRSHSSHSLNSYNAAEPQSLFLNSVDHQLPFHFGMSLCKRLHLVMSLTRCPRRRLFNRTCFRVMWPFRRLSMVLIPYPWMLLRRRPHPVLCLSMSPAFSFSVDASVQTLIRCVVQHDAATQLPLTEFFIDCIYSNSPLDRLNPVLQSPPPMQGLHVLPQSPPGLAQSVPPPELVAYSHLLTNVSSSSCHTQQSPVSTTHVGTHPVCTASSAKRSASTALAGTHNSIGSNLRTDAGLFRKPKAVILPMVNFGQPKSNGLGPIATADSDLMHHQFRLSLLQWNPGPARRNPSNIVSAACGRFHAVILQEASDHVPHISDYFRAYTDNMDLAILLNKDTFEPDPTVLSFKADSTSKNTWGMVLLIVRALLRRPSLSGTPTVTFCSVHINNVVAKKRDASTELLQFLHAKMLEHNVDFTGGDFNMSAFSTVSDVFSDPEFSAPGHSCLWGLGALDEQHRECTGFLIMPKRPYEWRVDSHGCYKLRLALDPGISLLTSLCFSTFATPIYLDPAVLCAVSKLNKEGMTANITNLSVPRNVAREHAPVHQGLHVASRQDHMCSSLSK